MVEGFYTMWFVGQFLFGIIGALVFAIWRVDGENTLVFCIDIVKECPVTCLTLLVVLPILIAEVVFLNILIDIIMALFSGIAFVLYLADELVRSKFK